MLIAAALWAPWSAAAVAPDDSDTPAPAAGGAYRRAAAAAGVPRVVLVAALILGSHAMHDGFAMIRWRAAGISARHAGAVMSERSPRVVVFLRWPPAARPAWRRAAMLAAAAGMLGWTGVAEPPPAGAGDDPSRCTG